MAKYDALIEINPDKVESLSEYIAYCKFCFKPKSGKEISYYLVKNNREWYLNEDRKSALFNEFKFLKRELESYEESKNNKNKKEECENQLAKKLKDYKSDETLKDFPLNWLKNEIIKSKIKQRSFEGDGNIKRIKQISNICENPENLKNYIHNLPKYSFAIWFKFKLKAPYFSKDDDEFYIIQNPILKETNFKAPMVRGSGWKGALAHAFRELFKEDPYNNKNKIESFLRIFGAGSESIKAIESYLLEKSKNLNEAKDKILEFMLFELGIKVNKELIEKVNDISNIENFRDFLKNYLTEKLENAQDLPQEFKTHKGRAVFYPTYFDKLSLEIINPHDRKKRAGKNPIHYEVVPKETEGIFQLIYIPFDGILKPEEKLKKDVKMDLDNICEAIGKLQKRGIGAKTKLCWGRFEIINKKVCINDNDEISICKGWERC